MSPRFPGEDWWYWEFHPLVFPSLGYAAVVAAEAEEGLKWIAKEVADSVLADKSAMRVTSIRRLAESSLIDAHSCDINGEPYWYYEYLTRKSPTKLVSLYFCSGLTLLNDELLSGTTKGTFRLMNQTYTDIMLPRQLNEM